MQDSSQEKIDIIDRNNNVIDTIYRKDLKIGEQMTRFVHIFVFDENGDFILHQRHPSKRIGANLIDVAGGFVSSGETFTETAVKELEEEFGLNLPLTEMFDVSDNWGIAKVFKCTYKGKLEDLKLEKNQVSRVFKLSKHEIYNMIRKTPFMFNGGFRVSFMHFWQSQFGFKKLATCDMEGNITGACTWEDMVDNFVLCATAHAIVENEKGEVFVQKRSQWVECNPNTLCSSAAGHVDEGETAEQAAYREVEEELGIKNINLTLIGKSYLHHNVGFEKKECMSIYVGKTAENISLEATEVAAGYWLSTEKLKDLLTTMPELFNEASRLVYNKYLDYKKEMQND